MGRYRELGVDLNKTYRDDLNANFDQIDKDFTNVNKDIIDAKEELEQTIEDIVGAGLLDSLKEARDQANAAAISANNKAAYANTEGGYAKTQGDYAKEQGDYANLKGDYANEKAGLANDAAANANAEATGLEFLKIAVVDAAQDANNAADRANDSAVIAESAASNASSAIVATQEATGAAISATTTINLVLPNVINLEYIEPFNPSNVYLINNIVSFNGSSFISLVDDNEGNTPVTTVNPYWGLLAMRGVDGTGAVSSVNGMFPDEQGNVVLTIPTNWSDIKGKPTVYPPSSHDHTISEITELQTKLDEKASSEDLTNLSQTVTDNKTEVTEHLANYLPHGDDLTLEASSPDVNNVYTIADFKRVDNSLYLKSVLSNPNELGNYQTATWKFYDVDGTTLKLTVVWAVTYDENGIKNSHKIISKVVAE